MDDGDEDTDDESDDPDGALSENLIDRQKSRAIAEERGLGWGHGVRSSGLAVTTETAPASIIASSFVKD